jgi:hypothetical protein
MGLAPSGQHENMANLLYAEVPVSIYSQPRRAGTTSAGAATAPEKNLQTYGLLPATRSNMRGVCIGTFFVRTG